MWHCKCCFSSWQRGYILLAIHFPVPAIQQDFLGSTMPVAHNTSDAARTKHQQPKHYTVPHKPVRRYINLDLHRTKPALHSKNLWPLQKILHGISETLHYISRFLCRISTDELFLAACQTHLVVFTQQIVVKTSLPQYWSTPPRLSETGRQHSLRYCRSSAAHLVQQPGLEDSIGDSSSLLALS